MEIDQLTDEQIASLTPEQIELIENDPSKIDEILGGNWNGPRFSGTSGNFIPGTDRFSVQVSSAIGKRMVPGKSEQPCKIREPESGKLFQK